MEGPADAGGRTPIEDMAGDSSGRNGTGPATGTARGSSDIPPRHQTLNRQIRLMQVLVVILAAIGITATVFIGIAINDIYNKLDNATIRLCIVEVRQWAALRDVAMRAHVKPPAPIPISHSCRALPGKGR